jgi:predicted adenine nucleotide alpha hydrolase (AANH) superfamily ATPase
MESLVLHTCCAPCAIHPYTLLAQDYDLTFFFFNPNIYPADEYARRLNELRRYSGISSMRLVVEEGRHEEWRDAVAGYESCEEGGERCRRCYEYRLEKTAAYADAVDADYFGTVMSISPHKKSSALNEAGYAAGKGKGVSYFESDFKKKDGFKKAAELSREQGFYRQQYCGCEYSIRGNRADNKSA